MRYAPAIVLAVALSAGPAARGADPRGDLRPAYGPMPHGFIEGITPPAVERGKTTRVTLAGRDFGPGLDLWHSLPAGALRAVPVESHADRLVFDVTAAADAPVGVCGVRAATRDGLTNAHLLLVDDLPVRAGATSDAPVTLAPPAAVWGTFRAATLDRYRIDAAAGERVSFEVVGNRLGKDADPLVTIRDAAGRAVAERDNDAGLYFDVRFEHRFETAGAYTIEVRDARFRADDHHHYVLRVGRFPAGRVAVPAAVEAGFWGGVKLPEVADAELTTAALRGHSGAFFANLKRPGDHGSTWVPVATSAGPVTVAEPFDAARDAGLMQASSGPALLGYFASPTRVNPFLALDRHLLLGRPQATPAAVPGTLCGVLRTPGRADTYRLRLQKGERIVARGEAKALNSPADLELAVIDRTGRELRRVGETPQTREEPLLDFTAPAAGDYGLVVRDVIRDGGDAYAYRVTVRADPFPPRVTADVEGLTVPRGTFQPLPVAVARAGATGPVRLALLGAPPGLTLAPAEIAATESAVVCRLEADATAPLGVHTIQIVAETDGPRGPERALVLTRPAIDRRMMNVDLIPIAPRDDQVRLPPSLADRFAVQVTPPAPFTFDLPEAAVTLPRYQTAAIPVATTRAAGFDGPVSFAATGGQLAPKAEGRTRVYAEFPDATAAKPDVAGVVASKILSNTAKARIDVAATGTHRGRRVTLTRTFELDLKAAFELTAAPAKVSLLPGESAKVRLAVTRLKSFDGTVTLRLNPMPGVTLPETVTVAKGQDSAEIDIAVSPDAQPRQQGVQITASADVAGFEEEVRGQPVTVEVKKVESPKKK